MEDQEFVKDGYQLEEWLDENSKWRELREYLNGDNVKFDMDMDMKVRDLKVILNRVDDDMDVIIPVLDLHSNYGIHGFRHVRTAGILVNHYEEDPALCLSAPDNGMDMESQLKCCQQHDYSYISRATLCKQVLF